MEAFSEWATRMGGFQLDLGRGLVFYLGPGEWLVRDGWLAWLGVGRFHALEITKPRQIEGGEAWRLDDARAEYLDSERLRLAADRERRRREPLALDEFLNVIQGGP